MPAVTYPFNVPLPIPTPSGSPTSGPTRLRSVGQLILLASGGDRAPLASLLDARETLRLASSMTRAALEEGLALVVSHLASTGELTHQSLDKFSTECARFVKRLHWQDVHLFDDVQPGHVQGFLDEAVPRRSGLGFHPPERGTVRTRRWAVQRLFSGARRLSLTLNDPARDLIVPGGDPMSCRPLSDAEELTCRTASHHSLRLTRLPAVWALGQATATPSEMASARVGSLVLDHGRVWLDGSGRRQARWGTLTEWGVEQLHRRVEVLDGEETAPIVYSAQRTGKSGGTASGSLLTEVLTLARLHGEPGVKPGSLAGWAGRKVFLETGDIFQTALALGVTSLDTAARIIGEEWR